jgi:hypothetical protein
MGFPCFAGKEATLNAKATCNVPPLAPRLPGDLAEQKLPQLLRGCDVWIVTRVLR